MFCTRDGIAAEAVSPSLLAEWTYPNVRYSSAVCACCRAQEAAGESRIGLGAFTRSPHEVRDRRGSLRRLPEPWRVAGGQRLQSRVRDELGHCLDDRNAAERVLFAPYHQRGHCQLAQLVVSHAGM